jgi:DNA-directed RNA polymerase subunit E'/Rpb7
MHLRYVGTFSFPVQVEMTLSSKQTWSWLMAGGKRQFRFDQKVKFRQAAVSEMSITQPISASRECDTT